MTAETPELSVKEITDSMQDPSRKDIALIEKAFAFAKKAHEGQRRFSGEPYFNHVYATGKNLADFGMDSTTIAAGFLHDTLEDACVDEQDLKKEFGDEIVFLVKGVTKLGKLRYRGLDRHIESLRKLFIATAKDIRVLIIKLADRLHNVSTLEGHPKQAKRKRIAQETLELYAPLADRLGMGRLKGMLEDYAFPHVFEEEFDTVHAMVQDRDADHKKHLEKFHRSFLKELAKHGMKNIKTSYRVKHHYSLWKKLKRYDMDIDKIYDLTALRVIVPTLEDCYRILGIIHGSWHPLPGRIKDYIALPKPNGYQSLHTTIFTGDGGIVEIQIRTKQMHHEAEFGIASHFAYKEGFFSRFTGQSRKVLDVSKKMKWISQLLDLQEQMKENDGEFIKNMKMNFFEDRVFVFTPNGDPIDLPKGATPIDLAYVVHSDLGDHMAGAKVNGKLVNLKYVLQNDDIVEITTKDSCHPTPKWLESCITPVAQRKVKYYLQKQKESAE